MTMPRESPPLPPAAADAALPAGTWRVLLWAALTPPALTVLLALLNVPLGCPGRFTYLYSPVPGLRSVAAGGAVALAALMGLAVWLIGSEHAHRRRIGWVLTWLAAAGIVLWTYTAPPAHWNQHLFNSQSPAQDGAFVRESAKVHGIREYLALFPQRARTPPAEMRGTRVVSNPPATTILAYALRQAIGRWPELGRLVTDPLGAEIRRDPHFEDLRPDIETGLLFQIMLTALWGTAGVALCGAARVLLPTPTAVAFAAICLFSPAGLLFTPGKDTAQLLTTALPLWLWLVAWRRGSIAAAAAAGLVFTFATLVSLVHIWLAAIVLAATAAQAISDQRLRRLSTRGVLPAIVGAAAGVALLRSAGCDWLATLRAAAAAQAQITRGPDAMPLHWQTLGVPLFLLFAGAAVYVLAFLAIRGRPGGAGRFGAVLVCGSLVVMLATVGFTNVETPRLWIPFTPLIMLGLMLRSPALAAPGARTAALLGALVFAQIASAAAQWTRMDMREAENRITSERFFH